jgi:hypothetical protein
MSFPLRTATSILLPELANMADQSFKIILVGAAGPLCGSAGTTGQGAAARCASPLTRHARAQFPRRCFPGVRPALAFHSFARPSSPQKMFLIAHLQQELLDPMTAGTQR